MQMHLPPDAGFVPKAADSAALDTADRALLELLLAGDRRALARAITLFESSRTDHRARARRFVEALLPHAGRSLRIGVSGPPGVGKSTFIETFGLRLVGEGHRVAVLAVDPSSQISGGSILGDKTRMARLAADAAAFVRPSPSSNALGGVADHTRDALLGCEAAGYDVVIVETVGVGQSEVAVASMTDCFVLLAAHGAGDDLQAAKRGVLEFSDIVVVNKADLDLPAAELARTQIAGALALLRPRVAAWRPCVVTASGREATWIDAFCDAAQRFRTAMTDSGALAERRRRQALEWVDALIDAQLRACFHALPAVRARRDAVCAEVAAGRLTAAEGAAQLMEAGGR
jgi:LAO/AO transport system kinase